MTHYLLLSVSASSARIAQKMVVTVTNESPEDNIEETDEFIRRSSRKSSSRSSRSSKKSKRLSMDESNRQDFSLASNLVKNTLPIISSPLGSVTVEELSDFNARLSLHHCALENNADCIRNFAIGHDISEVKKAILTKDKDGNNAAMVAALHNNKEALMALLGPFFIIPHDEDIQELLHHLNKKGQNLMAIVVVHRETLFAAHGLLVEFEAACHNWDFHYVQRCLRYHLGKTFYQLNTRAMFLQR